MKAQSCGTPTIKDVALACGVSEATVSYLINGKRALRPETRERIHRAMQELNYHPSAVARGLSSKRVHTVGVLFLVPDPVESITNPYASGILQGVVTQAQREGFNVTLFTDTWRDAATSARPLADGRADGILAVAPLLTSDVLQGLASLDLPVVAIAAEEHEGVTNINVDNYTGAQMAAEHLLQLGHHRIAYLTGDADMADYQPRYAGFCDALQKAGVAIAPEWIQLSHLDGSQAFEQTLQLLGQPHPPTAICAGNDVIALMVMEAARSIGVSVPQQLSVIGFDDIPAASFAAPQLTTIRQPLGTIGSLATGMLIERLRGPDTTPAMTLVPCELIVRGSTAPPAHPGDRKQKPHNPSNQSLAKLESHDLKTEMFNPSSTRPLRTAFTLIELLVVVTIIALLAAILFPAFSRARENARRSNCQSNLKQIGLGILQYTQDYDEIMPKPMYCSSTGCSPVNDRDAGSDANNYKWMDAVYPYIKNRQVFVCPSTTRQVVGSTATNYYFPDRYIVQNARNWGSYGLNNAYMGLSGGSLVHGPAGQKLATIANSAETVLVTDTNGNYECGPFGKSDITPIAMVLRTDLNPMILKPNELTDGFATAAATVARHLDFSNVLYCDGHVKASRLEALNETITGKPFPNKTGPVLTAFTIEDD